MNENDTGLLYNLTGDGKGKTTSALGIAVRALGWGWKIAVLQFIKGDFETGERRFFRRYFPDVFFESRGLGLTVRPGDHAAAARQGWETAKKMLREFDGQLLILDELNNAVSHGFLDGAEVAAALKNRRPELNVVITGRNSPGEICAVCDLVSEVKNIKHPYQRGIPARKGLDC